MKNETQYDVPGLRDGLRLFRILCESPKPLGLTELCEASGENKHKVFRCLKTFLGMGLLVEQPEGPKYEPTLLAFRFSAMPVARMNLVRAAQAPLAALSDELGEAVYLGVLRENKVFYLLHHESRREIRSGGGQLGGLYDLHADAAGKVLAAFGGEALQRRLCEEGFAKHTGKTIAGEKAFLAEMAKIRKQGSAEDDEEYMKGIRCFAAPVFKMDGEIAGAVCCSVLTLHYSMKELVGKIGPRVLACAGRVSATLGWTE